MPRGDGIGRVLFSVRPMPILLIWVPGWPAEFILDLEETGYRNLPKYPL